MKSGENEVQSDVKHKAEDFINKYKALCHEMGFHIVVNPAFRVRDDGTWSVIVQTSVGELPKKK